MKEKKRLGLMRKRCGEWNAVQDEMGARESFGLWYGRMRKVWRGDRRFVVVHCRRLML